MDSTAYSNGDERAQPVEWMSPEEFAAADFPQPRFIIDGLVPEEGVGLLVASPKTGKSTLAAQAAVEVSRGGQWLGRQCTEGMVGLLVASRDEAAHPAQVRERLTRLGWTSDDPVWVNLAGPGDMNPYDWLRAGIERYRPTLVVIDMLAGLITPPDGDWGNYGAAVATMTPLREAIAGSGCAVMLLHHARKTSGEFGTQAMGSTAWAGLVDVVIDVYRDPETGKRYIESQNRFGHAIDKTYIEFDPDTGRSTLGGTKAEMLAKAIDQDVLDYVGRCTEAPNLTEIRANAGHKAALTGESVKRLERQERLVRVPGARKNTWRYVVPHVTGHA